MANEIRNYILAIIIFTAFIVGGTSMFIEFKVSKPEFPSDERFERFNDTFNTYLDVNKTTSQVRSRIEQSNATLGVFGGLNSLILTTWNTFKLTASSYSFMNEAFLGTNSIFGIPTWVAGLISTAIVVIIIYGIIKYIFRTG